MKECPQCQSRYSDDTLAFCLQDGTPLQTAVSARETETVVAPRLPTPAVPWPETRPVRRRRTGLVVFATAAATAFVVIGAIAVILLFSRRGGDADRSGVVATPSPTATPKASATPTATPTATPSVTPTATPPPPTFSSGDQREITEALGGWRDDTESLDIESLASRYADTVNYYKNGPATRDAVIRDKERAFAKYDSINLVISNIFIEPGKAPDSAVVEFDKAWTFDGDNSSSGKVRSRLTLRKANGKWLIDGEQDIKVY